ncbi:MAG: LysE family transporter [Synergistaceae bacterium]|nr:LysE family transporter [Synergistaceae bacterium]
MLQVILSYLPYALVTTFTPGPNNIMSFYVVSSSGWRKGREVISGIFAGFSCLISLCVLFCHELSVYLPELVTYLKYIGAVYIIWLAVHIAMSRPSESQNNSLSFRGGFFLAVSNIKVILYLVTLFSAYIIPSGAGLYEMSIHAVFIVAISAVSWFTWGAAGGLLQRFIAKYYRPFNILMGIILLWCVVQILK